MKIRHELINSVMSKLKMVYGGAGRPGKSFELFKRLYFLNKQLMFGFYYYLMTLLKTL